MTIYLHHVIVDSGFAPCVQNHICTLNICKPHIRRIANVGDLVIGIMSQAIDPSGSILPHFEKPIEEYVAENFLPEDLLDGDFRIIYAMEVTEKITMQEYDHRFGDQRRDSIYDFINWIIRRGPHGSGQQKRDLSGENTLISNRFVYYGRHAPQLDEDLLALLPYNRRLPRNPRRIPDESLFAVAFRKWLNHRVTVQNMWFHEPFLILGENAYVEPHEMLGNSI